MDLSTLSSHLSDKKGIIYTFLSGKVAQYTHKGLGDDVAKAIIQLQGWGVSAGMRVGIYAPNSYRWLVYDLALISLRAISMAFTADFSGQINQDLLDRYNIGLLLISKRDAGLFADRPAHVALIDGENDAVRVMPRLPSGEPDEADQLSRVFSSGSAGGLKGLIVSRKGVEETLPPIYETIGVRPEDRLLLFLPMSNFQQRNMCYAALHCDCDLIITDYTGLFPAMRELDPTILIAPPVFYQMVHAQQAQNGDWREFLQKLLGGLISVVPGERLRRSLARTLFRDFHQQFGTRMRLLITGMAPIRHEIGAFFSRMQLPLCETYGMMEAGSISFRPGNSRKFASVGRMLRGVTLSFREDGEILVRRPHQMTLRYFQCADGENEQTFLGDGCVATGDIGRLDADGYLYLLGRKKELIVTPGGLKIHPEVIEQELNTCPGITNSVVLMRPGAAHLTCIIDLGQPELPDTRERVTKFANQLKSTRTVTQFMEVVFAEAPFSAANGTLRPNMKVDRKRVAAAYGI